jgi:hypothetical protein
MPPICKEILRLFSRGFTLTEICISLSKERGEGYSYADIREWLTSDENEEEYAEFRIKFVKIQKNSLPLMREEIREAALDLKHHIIEDKKTGLRRIQPEKWQHFRAMIAVHKTLSCDILLLEKAAITQALFLKRNVETNKEAASNAKPGVLARASARANSTSEGAPAPSSLTPSPLAPPSVSPLFPPVPGEVLAKIGGTQADWRALPRIDLSTRITAERAEEFLGYPLPQHIFPAIPRVIPEGEKPRQEDIIAFIPQKPKFDELSATKYSDKDIIPHLRPYARIENGSLKYITFDVSTGVIYQVMHFTLPTGGWKNKTTGEFVFFNSE